MSIVIKRFIERVDTIGTEAWIAILNYIDTKIDDHDNRLKKLEDNFEMMEENVNKTKAIIDSNTELSKTVKKTAITGLVSAVVAYVLSRLGIV